MLRSVLATLSVLALVLLLSVASGDSDPIDAGKKKKTRVPAMAKNTYVVAVKDTAGGSGDVRSVTVSCDPGDKILSGGFDELDPESTLRTNSPSDGEVGVNLPNEWIVAWQTDGSDDLVDVFALCSDFPPRHQPEA